MRFSIEIMAGGTECFKRLMADFRELTRDTTKNSVVSACPRLENTMEWIGTIRGGEGTVYEGKEYKLSLQFPSTYPHKPPLVKFTTPCFHPNVDQEGTICLDILKENWSSTYGVRTILHSIQSLLADPNNKSPLNAEAARLWNSEEYKEALEAFEGKRARKK